MSRPATPDHTDAYSEQDYQTLIRHVHGWAKHPDPRMGPGPTASRLYRDLTTYHHLSPRAALEAYSDASGRDIVRLPTADTVHVTPRTEWGLRGVIEAETARETPDGERIGTCNRLLQELRSEASND